LSTRPGWSDLDHKAPHALQRQAYHSAVIGADIVAIQIPIATAVNPMIKLSPIFSPIANAPTIEAKTGLTVMVTAVFVGVVRESAKPKE